MTKIIIKRNKFLEPVIEPYVRSIQRYDGWRMPSDEVILERIDEFKKVWKPLQEAVLHSIEKYTNGTFRYSIVDVSMVSTFPRTFSNPIILGVTKSDNSVVSTDELLCRLIHELIHKAGRYPMQEYRNIYPAETLCAVDHVFVHALLKHIYIDVLHLPRLLTVDYEFSKKHSTNDYARAWEIVDRDGHEHLLAIALKSYANATDTSNKNDPQ